MPCRDGDWNQFDLFIKMMGTHEIYRNIGRQRKRHFSFKSHIPEKTQSDPISWGLSIQLNMIKISTINMYLPRSNALQHFSLNQVVSCHSEKQKRNKTSSKNITLENKVTFVTALISLPFFRRVCIASTWPFEDARWRGVLPSYKWYKEKHRARYNEDINTPIQ